MSGIKIIVKNCVQYKRYAPMEVAQLYPNNWVGLRTRRNKSDTIDYVQHSKEHPKVTNWSSNSIKINNHQLLILMHVSLHNYYRYTHRHDRPQKYISRQFNSFQSNWKTIKKQPTRLVIAFSTEIQTTNNWSNTFNQ